MSERHTSVAITAITSSILLISILLIHVSYASSQTPLPPPDARGTITGIVQDVVTGKPIVNANV